VEYEVEISELVSPESLKSTEITMEGRHLESEGTILTFSNSLQYVSLMEFVLAGVHGHSDAETGLCSRFDKCRLLRCLRVNRSQTFELFCAIYRQAPDLKSSPYNMTLILCHFIKSMCFLFLGEELIR
jgi:hypothetical protein